MADDPVKARLEQLAAKFNLNPQGFAEALKEAARAGDLVVFGQDRTTEPALRGLGVLGRIVSRELPPLSPEGAKAFGAVTTGLCRRFELRNIAWANARRRPRIDGLPESLLALATAKEEQPDLMAGSDVRPAEYRALAERITVKREYREEALTMLQMVEADLAEDEHPGAKLVEDAYVPVRELSKRNRELGKALGPVERYLYEPAQEAADRRVLNQSMQAKTTTAVRDRSFVSGIEEGEKRTEEKLRAALSDGPGDPAPAGPPADRRGDRR